MWYVCVKLSCILYTYTNSKTTSFVYYYCVNSKLKPTITYNKYMYKSTSWACLKLYCQLILFNLRVVFVNLCNFCKVFFPKTQTKLVWCDEINALLIIHVQVIWNHLLHSRLLCKHFILMSHRLTTLKSVSIFKPGVHWPVPAAGWRMPVFLKLTWFACRYVCVCVSVYASSPKAFNNQWCDTVWYRLCVIG